MNARKIQNSEIYYSTKRMHRSRSLLTATRGKRILHLPHAQPYSLSATRGTMVSRKGTRPSRNFSLRFGPQENSFPPTLVFSNHPHGQPISTVREKPHDAINLE